MLPNPVFTVDSLGQQILAGVIAEHAGARGGGGSGDARSDFDARSTGLIRNLTQWIKSTAEERIAVAKLVEREWPRWTYLGEFYEPSGGIAVLRFRHQTGMKFVLVPGIRVPSAEAEGVIPHVDPFMIMESEVTQKSWMEIMGTNPSAFRGDSLPVDSVSWSDAADFCMKCGFQLPTPAEWQYAGEVGRRFAAERPSNEEAAFVNAADISLSRSAGELPEPTRYRFKMPQCGDRSDGHAGPAPLSTGGRDGLGLSNLLGNVWEWTAAPEAVAGGAAQSVSEERFAMGGSWATSSTAIDTRTRVLLAIGTRSANVGFRPVFRL